MTGDNPIERLIMQRMFDRYEFLVLHPTLWMDGTLLIF